MRRRIGFPSGGSCGRGFSAVTGTSVRFRARVARSSRPRSTTSSVGVSWTRRNGSHPSYCARRAGPVTRNVARNVRRSSRTWAEQRYGRANSCESREPRRRDHRMITARDSEPLARHGIVSCRVLRTWSLTCDDASSSELVVTVGYAPRRAVRNCKTLDTGSIPVAASKHPPLHGLVANTATRPTSRTRLPSAGDCARAFQRRARTGRRRPNRCTRSHG